MSLQTLPIPQTGQARNVSSDLKESESSPVRIAKPACYTTGLFDLAKMRDKRHLRHSAREDWRSPGEVKRAGGRVRRGGEQNL